MILSEIGELLRRLSRAQAVSFAQHTGGQGDRDQGTMRTRREGRVGFCLQHSLAAALRDMKRPHAMAVIREPIHATPAPIAPIALAASTVSPSHLISFIRLPPTKLLQSTWRLRLDRRQHAACRMLYIVHGAM